MSFFTVWSMNQYGSSIISVLTDTCGGTSTSRVSRLTAVHFSCLPWLWSPFIICSVARSGESESVVTALARHLDGKQKPDRNAFTFSTKDYFKSIIITQMFWICCNASSICRSWHFQIDEIWCRQCITLVCPFHWISIRIADLKIKMMLKNTVFFFFFFR